MKSGKLRHRIIIQDNQQLQDQLTGEPIDNWVTIADKVPAEIAPLSGHEFIGAQSEQSEITAHITIRYRQGVKAKMRILHKERIYNIQAVLNDNKSGIEYLTLPVSEGVNNG